MLPVTGSDVSACSDWMPCHAQVTGEDTSALQAVLAADPERLDLLAEEARLMTALNQEGTSGGQAHTNGEPCSQSV